MTRILIAAISMLFVGIASATPVDLKVKPGALNRITFAEPFETTVFSPGSPMPEAPTKMGGDRTLVMQINSNARAPFQLVAQLIDGSVVELNLIPDPEAPALSWTQNAGFKPPSPNSPARLPIQRPEDQWLKEVFYEVVQGFPPPGFSSIKPPSPGQIGTSLKANYIAAFRNQNYVLLVMTLQSDHLQWIAPQDLYAPGIKAVLIDGDRVGGVDAPVAYVLMAAE